MQNRTMRKHKLKKLQPINFTPMVDLNMLLVVFFMFCNTMSKPNTIDITLPLPNKHLPESFFEEDSPSMHDLFPVTFILGANNTIYRYTGMPRYEDYTSIEEMTYTELRPYLLDRFRYSESDIDGIAELKKRRNEGIISHKEYKEAMGEIEHYRKRYSDPILIKPSEYAKYKNLIDFLDEMDICQIPKFSILDMTDGDYFLLENYHTKGELAKSIWSLN